MTSVIVFLVALTLQQKDYMSQIMELSASGDLEGMLFLM